MLKDATNAEKLELMKIKLEVLKIAVKESNGSYQEALKLFNEYMELVSIKMVTSN